MPRHALSLYFDTSVLGGYFDAEFQADTRALWRLGAAGRFHFFVSQVVVDEIAVGPGHVRALLLADFPSREIIAFHEEMKALAPAYMMQKVVPPDCLEDAQHVAACTMSRLDYLVSWNFKDLAHMRREAGFNAVNGLEGYPSVRTFRRPIIHGHQGKKL